MEALVIEDSHQLSGTIKSQGAKNGALQATCVTLLTPNPVTIRNIPDVLDINNLIKLIQETGAKVTRINKDDYVFQADKVNLDYLDNDASVDKRSSLCGSALMVSPSLGRFGRSTIAKPGGNKVGHRRLDIHFLSFKAPGAKFRHDTICDAYHTETASKLRGCYMPLGEMPVIGTANTIMAVMMAEGITTMYNAVCEPYIQQSCHLSNAMGANISGIASNLLTVIGVKSLCGAKHTVLPDMIGAGPFVGMAVVIGNGVRIKDVAVWHLGVIPDTFRRLGIKIKIKGNDLLIPRQSRYQIDSFIDGTIVTLNDASWSGLAPGLLSVLLVVVTQACGCVSFHQRVFKNRLFFVDKLIDMRAQITLCNPYRAVVIGHDCQFRLRAGHTTSLDVRIGIALLITVLSAEGISRIENTA